MAPAVDHIRCVVVRDLGTLASQIEAYAREPDIWRLVPGVNNSAGTLALHLAGNIQHYIGAVLGGSGYVRDRDAEFSLREVPRADMIAGIRAAIAAVEQYLPAVSAETLAKPYPEKFSAVPLEKGALTTGQFLVHLVSHLSYHLGQVDYHRRALTGGGPVADALSLRFLADRA